MFRSSRVQIYMTIKSSQLLFAVDTGVFEEHITSRGPLIRPVLVMANSNAIGAQYKASVKYTVSQALDPLGTKPVYHWVVRGWSK